MRVVLINVVTLHQGCGTPDRDVEPQKAFGATRRNGTMHKPQGCSLQILVIIANILQRANRAIGLARVANLASQPDQVEMRRAVLLWRE